MTKNFDKLSSDSSDQFITQLEFLNEPESHTQSELLKGAGPQIGHNQHELVNAKPKKVRSKMKSESNLLNSENDSSTFVNAENTVQKKNLDITSLSLIGTD